MTGTHHFDLHLPSNHNHNSSHSTSPSVSSSSSGSSFDSPLDNRTHKHYQSHQAHPHVETPHPMIEHAATFDHLGQPARHSSSFFDVHAYSRVATALPKATSHTIDDHITNYQYNRTVRAAKKEAQRLAEHEKKPRRFTFDASRPDYAIEEEAAEVVNDNWKEQDEKAWAEELRKREAARQRCVCPNSWEGGWQPGEHSTKS